MSFFVYQFDLLQGSSTGLRKDRNSTRRSEMKPKILLPNTNKCVDLNLD